MGVEVGCKALQVTGLPPSPREAHLLLALDARRLLVLGGGAVSPAFGPQQFNDTFVLDLEEVKWSYMATKGDQPSPRTGASAVALDGQRVLLFGGSSMLEGYMNDVYVLDTKDWVWSKITVRGLPPSPRDKHTACLLGSKMYVFGGFGPSLTSNNEDQDGNALSDTDAMSPSDEESAEEEDDDGASISFTWFDDLHVLDVTSMEWQSVETKGTKPSPRAAHAAFIIKALNPGLKHSDKMIVFGGRDSVGRQKDLFTLNLQTLDWIKEGANCPPARSFHSMVPFGESQQLAVCYGGVGIHGEMFPGLELLNVESMDWTSVKSSNGAWPPLRGASAIVARHNKEACEIIIFGGSCSMEDRETVYYNDCYAIDVSSFVKLA
ncbi:hypothetical protein L7F22_033037 [Adiantum nelumboides]|nr:hypothetical protein [Adiantum nelumboides]